MRHGISLRLRSAVIAAGLMTLLPLGPVSAADPVSGTAPTQVAPTGQADVSGLDLRLQTVKKDLEIFLTFAEHFINSGETKTAAQLQGPLDNYLARHADYLVAQAAEYSIIESPQLSAEIMLIKIRLFITLNYRTDANTAIAEMKKLFAPYQKLTVQILGKATTLDEAIRQLDNDLAKTAAIKK